MAARAVGEDVDVDQLQPEAMAHHRVPGLVVGDLLRRGSPAARRSDHRQIIAERGWQYDSGVVNSKANLLIVNGQSWPPGTGCTALAVAGESILATGTEAEIRDLAAPGARILDAGGGTILPAFNDAHVHFLSGSRALSGLDLFGAADEEEVLAAIEAFLAAGKSGSWLVGRGWQYAAFRGGMPALDLLDRDCPDRPAYLEAYDGHTAWVNSPALRLAKASEEALRTGIVKEAEMATVERVLPASTFEEDLAALRRGMAMAAARGVASVQEAGAGQDQLALYQALSERGELTLRMRLGFDLPPGLSAADWARRLDGYAEAAAGLDGRWLSGGILKAFADGVIESRTAALLQPYEGVESAGEPNWDWSELRQAVTVAHRRGWQVQVHAIGDAAVRAALDAFEAAAAAGPPGSRRHRVEHVETVAHADLPRFGRLGVIASMQPAHAEPGRNLREAWAPRIGAERAGRGWAWGSILRGGGRLAFGSDWPVVALDPFRALHVATNRTTVAGDPAGGWLPGERISLAEAVAAHTEGAAYAEGAEGWKGTLRPGQLADIAILGQDLSQPGLELAELTVAATVVGGRIVYEEAGAAS